MKNSSLALATVLVLACSSMVNAQSPFNAIINQMQQVADIQVAQKRAADAALKKAADDAEAAHQEAVAKASAAAKAAAAEAAKEVSQAQTAVAKAATVPADLVKQLVDQIRAFQLETKAAASRYEAIVTMLAIGGIVLSLLGGISSFLSWPKVAGILALVVTAVLAVPKGLPIDARAKYFRILATESNNLLLDAQLSQAQTPDDYQGRVKKFAVLNTYASQKYPDAPDIVQTTENLAKDLQAAVPAPPAKVGSPATVANPQ